VAGFSPFLLELKCLVALKVLSSIPLEIWEYNQDAPVNLERKPSGSRKPFTHLRLDVAPFLQESLIILAQKT